MDFIEAMDKAYEHPMQLGENGHQEYGWSTNIKERIVQLNFQLVRNDNNCETIYANLLREVVQKCDSTKPSGTISMANTYVPNNDTYNEYVELLLMLVLLVPYTRDIISGKGECKLSYMLLYQLYLVIPDIAYEIIRRFVFTFDDIHQYDNTDKYPETHPYGSFKDFKYLCEYVRIKTGDINHPIIKFCVCLCNETLEKASFWVCPVSANKMCDRVMQEVSLIAKWIPREKSKFSWLYKILVESYFNNATFNANLAKKYRKLISSLNKQLDTLEIKQCGRNWANIDFKRIPSVAMSKQKLALMNKKKSKNKPRIHKNEKDKIDREVCAKKMEEFIQQCSKGEAKVSGKRVSMEQFTKQALELLNEYSRDDLAIQLLNAQWNDNSTQTPALGNMVAMVDVSGSMKGDPLHVAIALGIRIAEKSNLGNRVLTFSETPTWHNLDCVNGSFVDKVLKLKSAKWSMNTNFHKAFDTILDAMIRGNVSPSSVENMVLVVLSDMQMDEASDENIGSLYEQMERKYAVSGYKPPHILFWNLRSTNGFPVLSTQKNVSMLSGFSPNILATFCNKGMEALKELSPWHVLKSSLFATRFTWWLKNYTEGNFMNFIKNGFTYANDTNDTNDTNDKNKNCNKFWSNHLQMTNMKEIFNAYLTPLQYNKICKYWRYINETEHKIEHFDYSRYKPYEEYSDDEETKIECARHNKRLDAQRENLKTKLNYYQQEYQNYITSIGYELNNRTYDESLFNLLNNGIVLE